MLQRYKRQDEFQGGAEGGGAGDQIPPGMTIQQLFNENRKLQRLMQKRDKDFEDLKGQLNGFSTVQKKISGLEAIFGGQQQGNEETSILDRALMADQQFREANPESQGIPLTVDMARAIQDAKTVIEEQKKIIDDLKAKVSNPQYTSEQTAFANLDSIMFDRVTELFGDAKLAEENLQDFERVAVIKMKELQKDPQKWRRLITNRAEQEKFVNSVIMSKFPKAFLKNSGAQPIDEYTVDAAMADLKRAEGIKDPRQRALLKQKARRRLLPEQLGLTGMGG